MNPLVIQAILSLVTEAIKDAPALVAEIEKLIQDARSSTGSAPIAGTVEQDMASVYTQLSLPMKF
jgi:hypothetical protein